MQYFSSPGRFMFYYVVCFNTFKFKCNLDTSSNLIKPDRFDHIPTVMTPPPPKKGHKMISFTWYYIYIVQLLYVHVQFKLLYDNILSCKQCLCPNSLHHLHIDFFPSNADCVSPGEYSYAMLSNTPNFRQCAS